MRRLLVVANQTVGGTHLQEKIAQCMAEGPCTFYLVVPATRDPNHSLVWTEGQCVALARRRLEDALRQLRDIGATVEGEVGDQSPLTAIADGLRDHEYDEIILSTLPPGISRWLAQDLPRRVRRMSSVPLTHITARAGQAAASPSP
jgi:hypothetical protein